MSFTTPIKTSVRHIASSSRHTLLHPIPCISYSARPLSRSVFTSQTTSSPLTTALGPTPTRSASLASASSTNSTFDAVPRKRPRATKAAIKMTPAAIAHLQALVSDPTNPKLLRISVKTRGCAGMAYHLDYVDPPGGKFDEVVEQDGVRVLIDSKALFSIIGSTMDWRDTRLSAGFVFENPNVVDTCGCGESFNIKF